MKPLSLIAVCSVLLLSAALAAPAQPRPWTVAVYMDADHNLDSSALEDLQEMTEAGPLRNVRVVYQLDRNDDAEGAGPGVERGLIENGQRVPVQRLPELDSDDSRNVAAFMTWAYTAYPSAHHGLVMWDHGGQWDGGFGGDTHGPGLSDEQSGNLTPEAFSQAARQALGELGIPQLDFLGFDTCLMGGAELIAQFAPLTRLYIADAEIDYGAGWNYAPTLQALDRTPEQPMSAFGAQEVRFWEAQHRSNRSDQLYGVHAAYDTSRWADVQAKLGTFAQGLTRAFATPATAGLLWRARGEAIQYDFSDDGRPGVTRPYVDLGQFASKVGQYTQDPALKGQAAALSASIAQMVVGKSVGKQRTAASALSIYYPTHQETVPDAATLSRYAALPMNAGNAWLGFERAWTAAVRADTTPPVLKNVRMAGVNKDGSAQFEFTAGGADVYAAMASLYQDLGHDQYLDYGDVYYTRLVGGEYAFDWQPTTWAISDGQVSSYLTADHDEPDDESMTASARYTPPGEDPFDVLVQFSDDGEVIGVLDDSGDTPIGIDLEKGGTLKFYVRSYDAGKDEYGMRLQKDSLKVTSDDLSNLKATLVDLPTGDFQLSFSVYDFAGNTASDFAEFSFK